MKGIVIENSLINTDILDNLQINRSWESGNWKLHEVEVTKDRAVSFTQYLDKGPWYIHFWGPGKTEVLVVYRDKLFTIDATDQNTWQAAISYGLPIDIPLEQLTFPID